MFKQDVHVCASMYAYMKGVHMTNDWSSSILLVTNTKEILIIV